MRQFDFDTVISRENTGSFKWDRYAGADILPLWVADMDFAIAPPIISAVEQRLKHPVFGYAAAPPGLIAAIITTLKSQFDWEIQPEWLVWLPGVVPGLSACCRAYGEYNDEVITCPPIYHHFLSVAQQAGKRLMTVPLLQQAEQWRLDFDAIAGAMNKRTKLFLLCSPHNPVGKVFTREELVKLCQLAVRQNAVVVSDEIHCNLVLDNSARHIPTAKACPEYQDNIVTLMSPSKTFNLAGMNCSFAIVSNPVLRKQFSNACKSVVPMVPACSYVAAEAAYRDGWEWQRALIAYLQQNYRLLHNAFGLMRGVKMTALQATYLAWLDVRGLSLENPQAFFEKAGVGFSDGLEFGPEGAGFVRLNFACSASQLEKAVNRMKRAIQAL